MRYGFVGIVAVALVGLAGCDGGETPADGGADGAVACSGGQEACDGVCVDTDTDRAHCGACGNVCEDGEVCAAGSCELSCPAGQTACGGTCHDLDTDRAHCGGCGTECGSGEICAAGSCEVSCPAGQAECDGTCHDTMSDPAHCGGCGMACAAGEVCMAGACATSCGAGTTECSGACVDLMTSPDHCGGCDAPCVDDVGASGLCVMGACRTVCDEGTGDCNGDLSSTGGDGCETPIATDPMNCGVCGRACVFTNATGGCTSGACVIATCDVGFDDCDMDATNGCETDIAGDAANCGTCGTMCASGEVCVTGACMPPPGEDCRNPIVLAAGMNTVNWVASTNDYLTTDPECLSTSFDVDGPDVVLSYTATANSEVSWTLTKPNNVRWVASVSDAACGMATPEISCDSQFGGTELSGSFLAAAGTTYYFYVADTDSSADPLDNPFTIDITETAAPCFPGVGGVVGNTITRIPSGLSFLTEYYVAADDAPGGFLYFGGTSDLWRIPKAGGVAEDVEAAAGIGSSELGYEMLIVGSDIFVVNDSTTGTTGKLIRISADGGATWIAGGEDYALFPTAPNDDFRGATSDGSSIFLITHDTVETEIWSVPVGAVVVPAPATLVGTIPTEDTCSGLAVDGSFFYTVCADSDDLIRIDRSTLAVTQLFDGTSVSSTRNGVAVDDNDMDGVADVVYWQDAEERVRFTCGLGAGRTPFTANLGTWGSGTSNYGLGFLDGATPMLWSYDDDTEDLIRLD